VRVYTRICARIDIRVYAKYARMIRVCVVRLYLSCTVDMFKILSVIIMPGHLKLEQQYYSLGSIKKQIENFIHTCVIYFI